MANKKPIKKSAGTTNVMSSKLSKPIVSKQSDTTTVVAAVNGYTQEKVEYVNNFLSNKKDKTNQDWVDVYNYIKGTNVKIDGAKCRACTMAKYTSAVRNYAKYGEITLRVNNKWTERKQEEVKKEENVKEAPAETTENVIQEEK